MHSETYLIWLELYQKKIFTPDYLQYRGFLKKNRIWFQNMCSVNGNFQNHVPKFKFDIRRRVNYPKSYFFLLFLSENQKCGYVDLWQYTKCWCCRCGGPQQSGGAESPRWLDQRPQSPYRWRSCWLLGFCQGGCHGNSSSIGESRKRTGTKVIHEDFWLHRFLLSLKYVLSVMEEDFSVVQIQLFLSLKRISQ